MFTLGGTRKACKGAAIDMHFPIGLPVDVDVEHDGWKCSGNRCRREQYATNEVKGVWMAVRRDCPNVPQDGNSCVEICCLYDKETPFLIFGRDFGEQIGVDIVGNGFVKRHRTRESVLGERGKDEPLLIDLRRVYVGIDVGERRVILRAEKGKRRDECAGAHTRNELELWAIAVRGPTDQKSSAECAVVAATRERQNMRSR